MTRSAVSCGTVGTALLLKRAVRANTSLARGAVAGRISTDDKWWEKGDKIDNLVDIADTPKFLDALSGAGDRLVIVDFYAQWCGACRSLYPKIQSLAKQNPEVLFLKVNFDSNKTVCKSLSVKVLPYFHVYRGAKGKLADFSCSVAKVQRLRDALSEHGSGDGGLYMPTPALSNVDDLQNYAAGSTQ